MEKFNFGDSFVLETTGICNSMPKIFLIKVLEQNACVQWGFCSISKDMFLVHQIDIEQEKSVLHNMIGYQI